MNTAVRLILLCARVHVSPDQRAEIASLIESDIDWTEFCALADRHGLAPLVFRHLEPLAQSIPRPIFVALWSRREQVARRNASMARELSAIVGLLEDNGIFALPYKGPSLALAVYGDLELREFGDLDILLRPGDARRAKLLLERRGYAPTFALAPHLEESLVRSRQHYEWPLVDRTRGVMVELHWRADPAHRLFDLDDERWWAGLPTIGIAGRRVRTLFAEPLLAALCLHGAKHFWSSLGWLVDVAELIRRSRGLDWDRILRQSTDLGYERKIALGLRLAEEWLQAPIPPSICRAARDGRIESIAERIGREFLQAAAPDTGVIEGVRRNLQLQDNLADGVAYGMRMLFTPGLGEWTRWTLPRPLHFLYWPLRLIRLAAKYLSVGAANARAARLSARRCGSTPTRPASP